MTHRALIEVEWSGDEHAGRFTIEEASDALMETLIDRVSDCSIGVTFTPQDQESA